jgi:hypothetical protein
MSGIMNNTARQFNLKCVTDNGNKVSVRVAPGFNVVEDEHWLAFVSKDGKKVDPYVRELKKKGYLDFGSKIDDLELEISPDTKAKSKSEPMAKLKAEAEKAKGDAELSAAEAEKAKAEAEKAKAEAEKAKAEAEKAKAEAEKAKAELEEIKAKK